VLLGGERVTAGLGAGWSAEELDALGLAMPRFRDRIDRLEEVLRVARGLWTDGLVTNAGRHVVARDLPLSPVPDRSPRLLVGGGCTATTLTDLDRANLRLDPSARLNEGGPQLLDPRCVLEQREESRGPWLTVAMMRRVCWAWRVWRWSVSCAPVSV
jgi:alkanesulfonate monooxygenase SsuD/methylene tetrahydromethanopterin reductase-like flavin-dependent oxidoreductase (luciferase family)